MKINYLHSKGNSPDVYCTPVPSNRREEGYIDATDMVLTLKRTSNSKLGRLT
jgi:hypothetical protein